MHRKLIIGIFICIFAVQSGFGQDRGNVVVIKDPRIDSLIARRLELGKVNNSGSSVSALGFRVQIFSGLSRDDAYSEQTKFKTRYPNVRTYISYTQPNYRVRVGDFRTKLEAQKFLNELKKYYSSLFVFAETIIPR